MKLCFPVEENQGLASQVYGHFGSAPLYLLVDTETQEISEVANSKHGHGSCGQSRLLASTGVDALVLAGVGRGALAGLEASGIAVYRAQGETVSDNLLCLADKRLQRMTMEGTCGGHQHGHRHGASHQCHH